MERPGAVKYTCISQKKGTPKHEIAGVTLLENYGVQGDAHAGPWHRQISLLSEADIEEMRRKGLTLKPGAFGENLVVENIDLEILGIGSRLGIGEAELEITQIGKVCHTRCAIYHYAGDCIMPRLGIFARVLHGGVIHPGAVITLNKLVPREIIQAGVLTVSDSCSLGEKTDTSGPAVASFLEKHLAAHIAWTGIVPDEFAEIRDTLKDLSNRGYDLIVTTGGTGCGPRDITPEATRAVIEREAPGLPQAMRQKSAIITRYAFLQRGISGTRGATLILNLPGSRKAAVENLQAVADILPHAIRLLRGETIHPEAEAQRFSESDQPSLPDSTN